MHMLLYSVFIENSMVNFRTVDDYAIQVQVWPCYLTDLGQWVTFRPRSKVFLPKHVSEFMWTENKSKTSQKVNLLR